MLEDAGLFSTTMSKSKKKGPWFPGSPFLLYCLKTPYQIQFSPSPLPLAAVFVVAVLVEIFIDIISSSLSIHNFKTFVNKFLHPSLFDLTTPTTKVVGFPAHAVKKMRLLSLPFLFLPSLVPRFFSQPSA